MPGSILAVSINSQGGSVLTFAFPVGVFIVVSVVLYMAFSRPHQVPGHRELAPAQPGPPDKGTAEAMAVAAGLDTAAGGGGGSMAAEPHGAPEAAAAAEEGAATETAQAAGSTKAAGATDAGTTEGTGPEAGE